MQIVKADKDQVVVAVEAAMANICALLRSVSNPDAPAVGTWTVRDVAAHLASAFTLYPESSAAKAPLTPAWTRPQTSTPREWPRSRTETAKP